MATILRMLIDNYRYINDEIADQRTKDWFLMGSPWVIITIVGLYLHFIHKSGPRLMERRKPFNLERIVQIYDFCQIITNAYIFYTALDLAWLKHYSFRCEPVDYSNEPKPVKIAATVWLYFLVKVVDLLDTVFFVLRKKQNQISFLHVYHHAGMALGTWVCVKYFPGGHVTFLGLVNSFVHMVMYTHYLVMSLKIANPWWKKHITQLQMTQFILILAHFSQLIWEDCGFPVWTAAIFIPQNVFMIALFGDFYYKTYIKKSTKKNTEQNGVAENTNGKLKM